MADTSHLHSHSHLPSTLIIDNSKKNDFEACPRKYFHSYLQNLDTPELDVKLHFGSCWHKVKQRYHTYLKDYKSKIIDKAELETLLQNLILSIPTIWKEEIPSFQIVYPTYLNPASLTTAFTTYLAEQLTDDIYSLTIEGIEEVFNIPMCTPSPYNIPFTLAGKIDLRGIHQGVNIILDDKTTGWNLFMLKQKNERSSQLITYSYAARRLYEEANEAAFKYLYISSKKKKSGEYGVLTINFDFQLVSITEGDISQWELSLIDAVERITKAERSGVWVQNLSRCFDYGKRCKFLSLCEQGRDADDTIITADFIKRERSWDEEISNVKNIKEEI